jgi:hypothetical protein
LRGNFCFIPPPGGGEATAATDIDRFASSFIGSAFFDDLTLPAASCVDDGDDCSAIICAKWVSLLFLFILLFPFPWPPSVSLMDCLLRASLARANVFPAMHHGALFSHVHLHLPPRRSLLLM